MNALRDDSADRKKRQEAAEEQNIRAMMPQFQPQFQQALYRELVFVRRTCKPEKKSFADLAVASSAELKTPLHDYVASYYGSRQVADRQEADPHAAIQNMLSRLVKQKLGDEKFQLYMQEHGKRYEAHKHAIVLNLVVAIDTRLVLTAEQRTKLVQALLANYERSWDLFSEAYGITGQYLPSVRDKTIVALLDDKQKKVWSTAEKISGNGYFGGNMQTEATPRSRRSCKSSRRPKMVNSMYKGRASTNAISILAMACLVIAVDVRKARSQDDWDLVKKPVAVAEQNRRVGMFQTPDFDQWVLGGEKS